MVSSTCFEPEGSSSGRRLYIQVWLSVLYVHQYKQSCLGKLAYADVCRICTCNRLLEDEPSGSKHVEGINN